MIGRTNAGGGGAGLNFKVVGDTIAPRNPKENMIWVNTDEKITDYYFSVEQPKNAVNGQVWIITGVSSTIEFNALKKNGIQICPISAKQYVSGAWVDKTAKSYQNGEWVDWYNGFLGKGINNLGEPSFSVIGGSGNFVAKSFSSNEDGTFNMSMKNGGDWMNGACSFPNRISLSGFTKLTIKYVVTDYRLPQNTNKVDFAVVQNLPYSNISSTVNIVTTSTPKNVELSQTIDVSSVSGGYIAIYHNFASSGQGFSYVTLKIIDIIPS